MYNVYTCFIALNGVIKLLLKTKRISFIYSYVELKVIPFPKCTFKQRQLYTFIVRKIYRGLCFTSLVSKKLLFYYQKKG